MIIYKCDRCSGAARFELVAQGARKVSHVCAACLAPFLDVWANAAEHSQGATVRRLDPENESRFHDWPTGGAS